MAGDWIPMRVGLQDELEVVTLSSRLERDTNWTVGALHLFWSLVDQVSTDGRLIGYTGRFIDGRVGVSGFTEAMLKVGWLTQVVDGFAVPNFDTWFGPTGKKRLKAKKRQQRYRVSVTEALQERDKSVAKTSPTETETETYINPPNPPLPVKGGTGVDFINGRKKRRPPKPSLADLARALPPDA